MFGSDQNASPPPSSSGREGGRNARYGYLVGRLRNRQITMEEATELFNVMQGMLQTSEAARAALMRVPMAPVPPTRIPPPPEGPARAAPTSGGDDLLLVGILAMGAGAGLLAAMSKRIQDGTTPPSVAPSSRPSTSPSSSRSSPGRRSSPASTGSPSA